MESSELESLSREFVDFYEESLTPVDLLPEERYIDREFIAEGATKVVYKATDTHCSRDVALALIKDDIFDFEQAVDFVREVQLTASLEHPNIIRIYDIGITESRPSFSVE